MNKGWFFSNLILAAVMMTACNLLNDVADGRATQSGQIILEAEMSHDVTAVVDETLITQADAIFLGQVDWVSATIWQQDGEQNVPTHQIAVTVLQPLVDEANLGSGGILTLPGRSPLDGNIPSTGAMKPAERANHNLQVGGEMIFFVQQTHLTHGNNSQLALALFSPLMQSIVGADQLGDLILQVERERPLLVQPQSTASELGAY
ncbi:MAG: hypothetical protein GY796_19945 [Chloroflexi bacterium]|nr:hypothetical protein [Chloroflexota bacterium]